MALSTQIRIEIGNERIIWSLDSNQRAMFKPIRPIAREKREMANELLDA